MDVAVHQAPQKVTKINMLPLKVVSRRGETLKIKKNVFATHLGNESDFRPLFLVFRSPTSGPKGSSLNMDRRESVIGVLQNHTISVGFVFRSC